MPTIAMAAAHIQAAAAPVIVLDTCVLLDIVRAPLRNAAPNVESAAELLIAVKRTPPTVHLVIACPTQKEWADHITEAVQDCEKAVRSVQAVSDACGFVGLPVLGPLPTRLPTLPAELQALSKELLDAAILLDKDGEALGRAIDRIIQGLKPARKGGQGAKDAVILEHAVSLADELHRIGFAEPRLFVSSNTGDFARASSVRVHPEIQAAFDPPRSILYFVSLSAAVAHLKTSGWIP